SAQSPCSIRINAGEQGDITAKRGEAVTVCLPLNAGTGYSWQVQDGGDAMTLAPKSTFKPGGSMPGARGTTRFTMTSLTPGDYTWVFSLVRPGGPGAEPPPAMAGLHIKWTLPARANRVLDPEAAVLAVTRVVSVDRRLHAAEMRRRIEH